MVSDSSVSAKTVIYETFYCDRITRVWLLCVAFKEERESVEKLERTKDGLVYTFLFPACKQFREYPSSPITTKAS